MSPLEKFYETTSKLVQVLEGTLNRDEKIVFLDQLLAERDDLLKEIKRPEPEETELAEKVVKLNQKLEILLGNEKKLIQKDMKALKNHKDKSDKYQNPYASVSVDGMFYDKRN